MSGIKVDPRHSSKQHLVLMSRRSVTTAPFALAIALLFAQVGSHAQTVVDPLPYSRGYLVTGNYVAASVDFTPQANPTDQNGFSTGTVHMSGVPADADVVAAYLYWETITLTSDPTQASGVKFRGEEILLNDVAAVKANSQALVGTTASCWSSGTPLTMIQFRADVLRFLPIRLDKDNKPTGKRLVNDSDLTAHGLPMHTVILPTRSGNQVPESAGASLVIVYRDPTQPLRKIVFYDGIHIQPSLNAAMTQTLRGFYKSSAAKSAKITHIVGSGQPNNNERVLFNDGTNTQVSPPDPISVGSSSQRGWANVTYDVSGLMTPGNNSTGGYGETATTTLDHTQGGGYDCVAWGAVIFSTAVADVDHDGLPDGLEDATAGLNDPPTPSFPNGQPLPNLNAMGAGSSHRDVFVEVNSMHTLAPTTYGSPNAPYDNSANPPVIDVTAPTHTHMPTPEDLKRVGDAYAGHGITIHFDVGDIDSYHGLGVVQHTDWADDYTSTDADGYFVPSYLARGGESIKERACDVASPSCQFPDYPGTVGWKIGVQFYSDAPVRDNGEELTFPELADPANPTYFDWNAGTHRRRFDRNRFGLFHYLLYAHTRGTPKSSFPCLINGQPGPYDLNNGTACTMNNPNFHVPSSASGIADLPGGYAMVTLGRWDEFVGRPFVRASTTFHEIGHNLNLFHGGLPVAWGNKALNTSTFIEPNCKPDYLSTMSYLFQVHGLFDDNDDIHLDLSGTDHDDISETTTPSDLALNPLPTPSYQTAWFAPANSVLASSLGVTPAKRFCSGAQFDPNSLPPSMARVHSTLSTDPIDWNGDGILNGADPQQDVNFDASLSSAFRGFDDWANLKLDQIGAGRRMSAFASGQWDDTAGGNWDDTAGGNWDDTGGGNWDDTAGGNWDDTAGGQWDDTAGGNWDDTAGGNWDDTGGGSPQELNFEAAKGLGRSAPYALKACVIGTPGCQVAPEFDPLYHRINVRWQSPPVGHIFLYHVSRKRGNASSSFPFVLPVPSSTSTTTTFVDTEHLPNGVQFTYRTRAEFDDTTPHEFSGFSRTVTTTAVNNPPVAVANSYTTARNRTLTVTTPGVLGNDTDVDSPAASLRAVLVTGPSNGTLSLNANGSFSYNPKNGFTGSDSFTYKANNGFWSADPTVPMSGDSNTVVVSITVTAK